jgi:hypothetical protein
MAHFYSTVSSKNTTHTKCGTKKEGMQAHIRGWDVGVQVDLSVNSDGEDVVCVYLTDGSNGHKGKKLFQCTAADVKQLLHPESAQV